MSIHNRGFVLMDKDKLRLIVAKAGNKAHAIGNAHKWTPEEARRAGTIGGRKRVSRPINPLYQLSSTSARSQLLILLQESLDLHPSKPVSFVALGNKLGTSRQYIRTLYYQLKKFSVPPVWKRRLGAIDYNKRRFIASLGGNRTNLLGKAHRFTSEEACRAGQIRGRVPKTSRYE